MPTWTIERLADPDELEDVLAIDAESFINPWTREMYLRELANPQVARVYVLRLDDGVAAAYCACWLLLDEQHINNLAVRPAYRARGFGSALLAFALQEGERAGARRATLEVRRSNADALRLYARFGFEVAGVRRGYYTDPPEDALILWREGRPWRPA